MGVTNTLKLSPRLRIQAALRDLMTSRSYDAVTVSDLIDRAGVSRSTFYRCYRDKLDVLTEMHRGWLSRLGLSSITRDEWLGEQPSQALRAFFEMVAQRAKGPMAVYLQTKDLAWIEHEINRVLADEIAAGLGRAFPEGAFVLPHKQVAAGVWGVLLQLSRAWVERTTTPLPPVQMAQQAHTLIRALIAGVLYRV